MIHRKERRFRCQHELPLLRTAGRRRLRFHPTATVTAAVWLVVTVGIMSASADPITPTGLGGLVSVPDLTGGGSKSLFEATGIQAWRVDNQAGLSEFIKDSMAGLVRIVFYLTALLAYAAIGLMYWLLSLTTLDAITDPIADAVGAVSQTLLVWLMPSAVVIGLTLAYLRHKGHDALNAVSWVLLSAVFGISLAVSPQLWVDGVNNARTVGADAVAALTTSAVSPDQNQPFAWPVTDYGAPPAADSGNPNIDRNNAPTNEELKNALLRKNADALWRSLVATPWCAIEFGSLEACQRYGADMVKLGSDVEARDKYIDDVIAKQEGASDAPTVLWVKGDQWAERLVLAIGALVLTVVFCGALLMLGFTALGALISTMLHLVVGAFFTLTWCIEGSPRRLGMAWLQSLIGTILQGIIALASFAALLVMVSAIFARATSWGWLAALGLAIAATVVARRFPAVVGSWFGTVGGGHVGAAVLGAMVVRSVSRAVGRGGKLTAQGALAGGTAVGNALTHPRQTYNRLDQAYTRGYIRTQQALGGLAGRASRVGHSVGGVTSRASAAGHRAMSNLANRSPHAETAPPAPRKDGAAPSRRLNRQSSIDPALRRPGSGPVPTRSPGRSSNPRAPRRLQQIPAPARRPTSTGRPTEAAGTTSPPAARQTTPASRSSAPVASSAPSTRTAARTPTRPAPSMRASQGGRSAPSTRKR